MGEAPDVHEHDDDDDFADGCDHTLEAPDQPDDEADLTILFAGVPADELEATAAFYNEIGAEDA